MGVGPAEWAYYCPGIPVRCDLDLGLSADLKEICEGVMGSRNMDRLSAELHAVAGGLQYDHDNFFMKDRRDEDQGLGTFRE